MRGAPQETEAANTSDRRTTPGEFSSENSAEFHFCGNYPSHRDMDGKKLWIDLAAIYRSALLQQ